MRGKSPVTDLREGEESVALDKKEGFMVENA